jgi:TRAP-type uncharacterized transport system fused permease subunit
MGLLMQGTAADIALATGTAALAVLAIAGGLGGWILGPANTLERVLAITGALLLFYAGTWSDVAGLTIFGIAVLLNVIRTRNSPARGQTSAVTTENL